LQNSKADEQKLDETKAQDNFQQPLNEDEEDEEDDEFEHEDEREYEGERGNERIEEHEDERENEHKREHGGKHENDDEHVNDGEQVNDGEPMNDGEREHGGKREYEGEREVEHNSHEPSTINEPSTNPLSRNKRKRSDDFNHVLTMSKSILYQHLEQCIATGKQPEFLFMPSQDSEERLLNPGFNVVESIIPGTLMNAILLHLAIKYFSQEYSKQHVSCDYFVFTSCDHELVMQKNPKATKSLREEIYGKQRVIFIYYSTGPNHFSTAHFDFRTLTLDYYDSYPPGADQRAKNCAHKLLIGLCALGVPINQEINVQIVPTCQQGFLECGVFTYSICKKLVSNSVIDSKENINVADYRKEILFNAVQCYGHDMRVQ